MAASPSSRRRPTRRQYALRRTGALVLVIVVAFAVWRGAAALFGGSDDGSSALNGSDDRAGDTSEPVLVAGAITDAAGESATGAAPGTTEVDDPTPEDGELPNAEPIAVGPATTTSPSKVFIVGDSDAGTFGPYLQILLDATGIVETQLDYKVSSGLARPDFYDWPAEIERMLPEVNPDIVVATFGGNDAQGLAVESGEFIIGDPVANEAEWTEEYQARAGAVMDQLLAGGRTLIWVGIPNDDNPDVTARMAVQDRAAKAAAAERPEVIFVDTWKRFSGRDGNWAEFVVDPRDGVGKDVRAADGFHLNETGAEILALDIAQAIRDTLRERGSDI